MIYAFTSAAPNYIGKVRALMESLRRWMPQARLCWLVVDDVREELREGLDAEPFDELLFASELSVCEDSSWLFRHDVVELSTAIKPFAAEQLLLRDDADLLLYFDPDIVLFSPLDDLLEQVEGATIALTPHQCKPEAEKFFLFHELDSLRYGVFNLGFFGLRDCEESRSFVAWWGDRCREACIGDWRSGTFTDQKWLNFAPIFFAGTNILRDSRFNVAPWNLSQRELSGSFDEGFVVDGAPLGFYHFTGIDSGAHHQHLDVVENSPPAVRMLVDWYERRTDELSKGALADWELGRFSNGEPIAPEHRGLYCDRVDLQEAFPDPYVSEPGPESYFSWLQARKKRRDEAVGRGEVEQAAGEEARQSSALGN